MKKHHFNPVDAILNEVLKNKILNDIVGAVDSLKKHRGIDETDAVFSPNGPTAIPGSPRLVTLKTNGDIGTVYNLPDLRKGCTVGREATVSISAPSDVSREHIKISGRNISGVVSYYLTSITKKSFTTVNGREICTDDTCEILDGDIISLGCDTYLIFRCSKTAILSLPCFNPGFFDNQSD